MERRIPKDSRPSTWKNSFMAQRARDLAWEYYERLEPFYAAEFDDADDFADEVLAELLRRAKSYGLRKGLI